MSTSPASTPSDDIVNDLRRSTVTGAGWSLTAQAVRSVGQIIVQVALARLLVPSDFGLVAEAVVFTNFFRVVAEFGVEAALVQRPTLTARHYETAFVANLAVAICLAGLTVASSPLIAAFYDEPRLTSVLIALSISFPLAALGVVHRARLQRRMRFRRLATIETIAWTMSVVIGVAAAAGGAGVWSLVMITLLSTTVTLPGLWRAEPWIPRFTFDREAFKDLLGFSAGLLGFNVINFWSRNADNLLVGRFLGAAALGIYSRSYALMLFPLLQLSAGLGRVMTASFALMQTDHTRLRQAYLTAIRHVAVVMFPLMTILFALADEFTVALLGDRWLDVIPLLRVFALVGMFQAISVTVGWIYQSIGRTDVLLRWGVLSGTLIVASIAFGTWIGSTLAVAISYATMSTVVLAYPTFAIPGRLIGLRVRSVVTAVADIALLAAGSAGAAAMCAAVIPLQWQPLLRLLLPSAFSAAVYLCLLLAFRRQTLTGLRGLLGEFRTRRLSATAEPGAR